MFRCMSQAVNSPTPPVNPVFWAKFELGSFQGAVDKQINIWLKGDPAEKPSNTVTLRVHIPQIIKITPRTIKWKTGSEPVMKVVTVEMDYEKAIHVKSVTSSNTNFEVKLVASRTEKNTI